MSDRPLFQNQDEQERAYAPQELGDGDPAEQVANLEEGEVGTGDGGDRADRATGFGALGLGAGNVGGGVGASQSTPGVGAGPAIGAAALGEELRNTDDERPRD